MDSPAPSMDRSTWVAVLVCVLLLIGWQSYLEHRYPNAKSKAPSANALEINAAPAQAPGQQAPIPSAPTGPEQLLTLENDLMRVQFTSQGGGVREVTLKKHALEPKSPECVVLNAGRVPPALAVSGWEGNADTVEAAAPAYTLAQNGNALTATRALSSGLLLERTFQLGDNYQIHLVQRLRNPGSAPVVLPEWRLQVGSAAPLHRHDNPRYLTAGWLDAAGKFHKTYAKDFDAGSFFGMGYRAARSVITSEAQAPQWVNVNNQFFTELLLPGGNAKPLRVEFRRSLHPELTPKNTPVAAGLTACVVLEGLTVPAKGALEQEFTWYAGPKEHARLARLGHGAQKAADFGWFGWAVVPLLSTLRLFYALVHNYGVAIVLLTLVLRLIFWPLQSAANRSMRQMQALAPQVEALRQRYKNDAQKLNQELIGLYKEHGVNPAGGCLPLLVQLPIFIGFYVMLQSATELRNQSFLWVRDLTQPDTIAQLPYLGWDVNPLPLLMTASSLLMVRMTPSAGSAGQTKLMRWMPLIFLAIFYNFAAALSLYTTVSNLLSMFQSWRNMRSQDTAPPKPAKA